ncbi:MAG: hypothetical protein M5U25_02950 [Planctomycetota bacterium]|nr:hypothetical protein [Planctomycetota bacterium]
MASATSSKSGKHPAAKSARNSAVGADAKASGNGETTIRLPSQAAARKSKPKTGAIKKTATLQRVLPNMPSEKEPEKEADQARRRLPEDRRRHHHDRGHRDGQPAAHHPRALARGSE